LRLKQQVYLRGLVEKTSKVFLKTSWNGRAKSETLTENLYFEEQHIAAACPLQIRSLS
jgi:hypothetical protein